MKVINDAIESTLTGNPALMALITGVHHIPAPRGATLPYVLHQQQAASDGYTWAGRSWTVVLHRVLVAVSGTSIVSAESIFEMVNALIDNVLTTNSADYAIRSFRRESLLEFHEEASNGKVINYIGGIYRALVVEL